MALIANSDPSVVIMNSREKSENFNTGAVVNLIFNVSYAFCCSSFHWNVSLLRISLVSGFAVYEKSLINRR